MTNKRRREGERRVGLQWLKDEQKTNKRRIYTEDKAKKGYRNIGY
ncbi:hypothetical protein HMPREF1977_1173 [Capnocytophaga ochracea F0287]|uniref:Uncharacterized protein n=1 Tax=Capnocytophaga ochracea F0287 TaxID=873517 RepID=E4MS13_CAPOC|nr:hypothetical protein HMPREF1977_1173 [Capnocytophaga ochracea F0287]